MTSDLMRTLLLVRSRNVEVKVQRRGKVLSCNPVWL